MASSNFFKKSSLETRSCPKARRIIEMGYMENLGITDEGKIPLSLSMQTLSNDFLFLVDHSYTGTILREGYMWVCG